MRILNYGSLNLDYVCRVEHFAAPGETISAESMEINPGGKGLNQSIALARAGAPLHPYHPCAKWKTLPFLPCEQPSALSRLFTSGRSGNHAFLADGGCKRVTGI